MHSSPPPSYPSAPRAAWLQKAAAAVDVLNDGIGRVLAWSLLLMTLAMLVVIFCASVLNTGWIWLSEIIVYLHALLFMGAAAYSLRHGRHVRIVIFYNRYCPRRQHWLNLLGVLFLLLPMCVVIIVYSYPYVTASWAVHETSQHAARLLCVLEQACRIKPREKIKRWHPPLRKIKTQWL